MVEPKPDIDIDVERDPFDLWKIPPPLSGSFSSVTDSCSKRDSIALIAILREQFGRL